MSYRRKVRGSVSEGYFVPEEGSGLRRMEVRFGLEYDRRQFLIGIGTGTERWYGVLWPETGRAYLISW